MKIPLLFFLMTFLTAAYTQTIPMTRTTTVNTSGWVNQENDTIRLGTTDINETQTILTERRYLKLGDQSIMFLRLQQPDTVKAALAQ